MSRHPIQLLPFFLFSGICSWGIIGNAISQTEAALPQDTLVWEAWRVRAEWPGQHLDSLWADSTWVWRGTCLDSVMTFRFDRAGEFALLNWPCEWVHADVDSTETNAEDEGGESASYLSPSPAVSATDIPPELLARVLDKKASGAEMSLTPRAWVRCTREKLAHLDWQYARDGSCFPPISSTDLASLEASLSDVLFERERMPKILAFAENRCFSSDQIHGLMAHVQSEDRRLSLLQSLLPHCSEPENIVLSDLFVMKTMENRARKLVENMSSD
ncbi:MAG: DUF4476 domain-containing protein [Flavobacteriales bacterium]